MTTTFVQAIPLVQHKSYVKSLTANTVLALAPDAATISALTSATVAGRVTGTATCAVAHNLTTGDEVTISGSTGYNGTYIVTVTGANTFTFSMASSAAGSSGTFVPTIHAQQVLLIAAVANGSNVEIGPNSSVNLDTILAGGAYNIPIPSRQKINLANWYARHATTTGSLTILYV